MKIWFQNRRTKWKKQNNISNAEAAEHKNQERKESKEDKNDNKEPEKYIKKKLYTIRDENEESHQQLEENEREDERERDREQIRIPVSLPLEHLLLDVEQEQSPSSLVYETDETVLKREPTPVSRLSPKYFSDSNTDTT